MCSAHDFKPENLAITFKKTGKLSREHKIVLLRLIRWIYRKFSARINYDHLNLEVPRTNLPLTYRGKRYDVSFLMDDRLVLIQIDTFKPKLLSKVGEG